MTAGRRASAAASSSLICSGGGRGRECPAGDGTRKGGRAEGQGRSKAEHEGGRAGKQETGAAAGRSALGATPACASPPPMPHLLDVLAVVVVQSSVGCSPAPPHPSGSSAAFARDRFLQAVGFKRKGFRPDLQGRNVQWFGR